MGKRRYITPRIRQTIDSQVIADLICESNISSPAGLSTNVKSINFIAFILSSPLTFSKTLDFLRRLYLSTQ
jgi:hypothetical protein